MNVLETIKSRRSIRTYSSTQKITPEQIVEIVEYWLYAPSAYNQQSRKYYIITKQSDLDFLWNLMEHWKMIPASSWVILACFDNDKISVADYVLSRFSDEQQELMQNVFSQTNLLFVKALLSSDPSKLISEWGKKKLV